MLYRVGDSLTLAYPHNKELRGSEVEILKIVSLLDNLYMVRILQTGQVCTAREQQLEPLETGKQPSAWEKCLWRPDGSIRKA